MRKAAARASGWRRLLCKREERPLLSEPYSYRGASEPLTAPTQKFNSFRRARVCFYPGSATSPQGHGANACNGASP